MFTNIQRVLGNCQGQFGAHVVGIFEFLQRRCFTESMIFAARVCLCMFVYVCVCCDAQVVYAVSALLWQPPSGGDDDTQ